MAIQFYGRATAAVFAPLESTSRSARVAHRLIDAIALGLLPDAEQLPGEADLAQQFGVSTVTIRESLSVLRQEGLIETRRGRGGGSFVRAPDDGPGRAGEAAARRGEPARAARPRRPLRSHRRRRGRAGGPAVRQ